MKKMRLMLNAVAVVAVCLLCGSLAQAQATRTWVSGVGDDANPCSRTAPCKTFAGAISKTAEGGEISVLDPGGFGALTITKAITINGEGTLAGVLSAGTTGFVVNVTLNPTTAVVNIRNVSINGARTGTNGISFLAGSQLHVENCTIYAFTTNGINVSLAGTSRLTVKNTSIVGNGSGSQIGIRMTTTAGTPTAMISNTRLQNLATGLDVLAGQASISDSIISGNSNFGLIAEGGQINADSCTVAFNGTGVQANGGATLRMANLGIYNNTTGIVATGTVVSYGDNKFLNGGNTTPGAPNAFPGKQ